MKKPSMAVANTKPKKKTYKQYAALPYTVRDGQLLVMLVTSRETGRWVIPKGWPEKNMAPSQVAAMEAFEEAGLIGDVASKSFATFQYYKRLSENNRKRCRVEVFLFAVHQELDDWREKEQRKREWMPPEQAATCVFEKGLIKLLRNLKPAEST
jgi:8-oxo-dGTP pyrophosphatase MutT (NUDIX family)